MRMIEYRMVTAGEVEKLRDIDRSERIAGFYQVREGVLVYEPEESEVAGFDRLDERVADLQAQHAEGRLFFGAFVGETLVGLCVLALQLRGAQGNRLQMSGLWVSRPFRRWGIGRYLVTLAANAARIRGAEYLYISGTPSLNTVRFYQSLGCTLTAEVDAELYAQEPEDIHFDLALNDGVGTTTSPGGAGTKTGSENGRGAGCCCSPQRHKDHEDEMIPPRGAEA
jgi:GNAT superfamily N-acetyltransferase